MKKLFMILLLTFAFSTFINGNVYAKDCIELADECYDKCDERWGGNTFWDGAGRNICKSGCVVAELSCMVSELLQA